MTYKETIDYLFVQLPVFQVQGPGAYKPGLHTAKMLADAFGNPQRVFRTVHVGGTNGKGSTSHMIASALAEAGYRVGLYTSPHVFDFRERIRVDGRKIDEDFVVDFVERYRAMGLDCQPSFFELTTIMAFDYFRSQGVDVAVVEVGLGGRLDTTNIIRPDLSVITNVSLDHVALLGDTEVRIAGEKAGIIKHGVPVVVGEADGDVRRVFQARADEVGAEIVFAEDVPYNVRLSGDRLEYRLDAAGSWLPCDLGGTYQTKNVNTVLHALRLLDIRADAIGRGLARVVENTHLIGRWMSVDYRGCRVVLDTGHNIGAWRYLAPKLAELASAGTVRAVLGFSNDKDVDAIFSLLPRDAVYYFVTPSVQRGRPSGQLLALAAEHGLRATAWPDVPSGFARAIADAAADHSTPGTVFVGGSNFVVADLPLGDLFS